MDTFLAQDETHPFLIQTLWKPGQSMLASALETMSLREIGPQLKFPRYKAKVVISFQRFALFFSSAGCMNHARSN